MKALVVDDHPTVRNLSSRLLASLGHEVAETGDPRQAEALVAAGGLDLVLLDLRLGGTDGAALAERMQAAQPALRILFMSGDGAEVFAARALEGPRRAFIQKPFSRASLADAVDALLSAP